VQEGIDTAYYAASEGRRLFGHTVPSELRDKWAMSYRRPIGVCGLITPFNFPMAIPTWKAFPALVCGNSIILKPAEDVPHTATILVEILLEAGLPPEVVQLVHGFGEEVGAAMVEHPGIPVISFTGSTETGSLVGETCGRMHKRLSLEMVARTRRSSCPTRTSTSPSRVCSGARSARPVSAARQRAGCCCTSRFMTSSSNA